MDDQKIKNSNPLWRYKQNTGRIFIKKFKPEWSYSNFYDRARVLVIATD